MQLVFSKKLKKTDVHVRLSFPMKVFNKFRFPEGKDKMELQVTEHSSQESWTFGLSRRNEDRHPHPKPVLSSGWRAYVKAKGLKENDKITLYEQKDKLTTKTRFKIRAQRKVVVPFKLLGKEIMEVEHWVDTEKLTKTKVAAS
ncbi:hypothetical protein DITRI_Ditri01bG0056200 [Diplodiscus trichospermus]